MSDIATGLLDTSVLVDHADLDAAMLPLEASISAISLAELAAGPHTTDDADERSRRQDRLQWAATTFDPIPFDDGPARAYGRVVAAVRAAGRRERSRVADLLIAATALAAGLPLFTRNPDDFSGLAGLIEIHAL